MPVKIMGRLPDGERNALADLAERLADSPHDELCAIVTLRPKTTEIDVDSDDEVTVKLRILDVEVIEGTERSFVEAAARSAREARTGRRSLPGFGTVFDPSDAERLVAKWAEEEASRAVEQIEADPDTGEISGEVTGDGTGDALDPWEDPEPPPASGRPGGHD